MSTRSPFDTDPSGLADDTDPAPPPVIGTVPPLPGDPTTDEQLRLEYLRRAVDADEERDVRRSAVTLPDGVDASGPNEPAATGLPVRP